MTLISQPAEAYWDFGSTYLIINSKLSGELGVPLIHHDDSLKISILHEQITIPKTTATVSFCLQGSSVIFSHTFTFLLVETEIPVILGWDFIRLQGVSISSSSVSLGHSTLNFIAEST